MTIKELIAILSRYDENTRVLIRGFITGVFDVSENAIKLTRFNQGEQHTTLHGGPYKEHAKGDQNGVILYHA